MGHRREAERLIYAVRVLGRQQEPVDTGVLQPVTQLTDEPPAQAPAAVLAVDVDVRDPGVRGPVRDGSRHADLPARFGEGAQTVRVAQGPGDGFPPPARRPVRIL